MSESLHYKKHGFAMRKMTAFRRAWLFPAAASLALVSALAAAPATPAHGALAPGTVVGGLPDLTSYCKAKGFQDANWQTVQTVADWQCVSPNGNAPITNDTSSIDSLTWDEACDLFYGIKYGDMNAVNANPDDPAGGVHCSTT